MDGPTRAFIGNSGTEAVEAAIKLARFATRRQYLVSFLGGFHGRSYGSVTLTASKAKYHSGFGPMLPGVLHVPFGNEGTRRAREPRLQAHHPWRRGRRDHRRADPGRGRLRRARGRLPAPPARAVRPPRDLAHCRRSPVGRRTHGQDVGYRALGRPARHRRQRQGHRIGHAARSDDRPCRPDELEQGPSRLDIRRQRRELCSRPGDHRPAPGRAHGQRRASVAASR